MATVTDVAKRAGVSVSSASRVLSGRGYASEDMRQRVLGAAQEVGYTPNRVARSLRLNRTRTIGLLIADVENYFYSQIAKSVEHVTKTAGYHVVLCNSNEDPEEEEEYLDLLEGIRVDGLIVTPTARNRRRLERLMEGGTTVVQIDRGIKGLRCDTILVDNEAGAANAVEHLISNGHTRIGILNGDLNITTGKQRMKGYERVLAEHGIATRPELVRAGSFRRESAIDNARYLISSNPPPTAIFATNNILAEACMRALAQLDLKVPQDISVVGFDDVPWMSMLEHPLTTVGQPTHYMARSATELLLRRLDGTATDGPLTIALEPTLIVRASVAKPRQS